MKKTPELSRNAAVAFSDKWKSYTDEKQHARGFWSDFFTTLCGVDDQEEAGIEYEKRVKSTISGNQEYIDVYWKNVALIEHKSSGENLDKAELQARGYWLSLAPGYRPKTIIISDFHNFRIVDVALNKTHEFPLSKLPENIHRFEAIISGNRTKISEEEITVDQQAAKLMANLYLELESHGFEGHETSIFLVRLLFLLFGDDTGMWSKNLFLKLVMDTKEDGSDVGPTFDKLYEVLNTAPENRAKNLPPSIKEFPYVNGNIFAEKIAVIDFNKKMRKALVEVANYDWTTINPTIFGSLFQLIKSKEERGQLGEHYTTEENINKIIYPLFLSDLQDRLANAWDSKKELRKLRQDLTKIRILDPACGCGNFLVVAYRHLRQLELELIVRLGNLEGKQDLIQIDGSMGLSINLNQFFGIEIEEWPAQIAQMALFLTDHQENLKLERITGSTPNRFPISDTASIFHGNALHVSWSDLFTISDTTIILGNPPFLGSNWQSESQREDSKALWKDRAGSSSLDFVANWYLIAAQKIQNTSARCAFVSTSSITHGEQPSVLWEALYEFGMKIDFAHRTFAWTSDAAGKAAVHCVIIGFSNKNDVELKPLWSYSTPNSEPQVTMVQNINGYLVNASDILITSRSKPINTKIQPMRYGNMPNEFGYLANIYEEDLESLRKNKDIAIKFIRPIIGAAEMLQNKKRYCLWLVNASAAEMKSSLFIRERTDMVRKLRSESKRKATVTLAGTPYLFQEVREQMGDYLAVPIVSSSSREYVPMKVFSKEVIPTNALLTIPKVELDTFAILQSKVFSLWLRTVGGKLKSDFRISAEIVYNNFPFPDLEKSDKNLLEKSGAELTKIRENFKDLSLADMYVPSLMPKELRDFHTSNDKLVLKVFGLDKEASDQEVLSKLFERYLELTPTNLFE